MAEIIEGRMAEAVDRWLDGLSVDDVADRRNGSYRRRLLSELGDIELCVPRTRRIARPRRLSKGRRLPQKRPRRTPHLLPLQDTPEAQNRAHH
ncbi:transposase, partial [Mesorhizobium sp.]|uniref:transposase n=1 Tax=Mesorhizobium sp. TaxID=1871066 RepID=UPI0025FCB89F